MAFNIRWAEYRIPRLVQSWKHRNIKLLSLRGMLAGLGGSGLDTAGHARFASLVGEIGAAEADERRAFNRIVEAEEKHRLQRHKKHLRRVDADELRKDPKRKQEIVAMGEPEPEESFFGKWFWFLLFILLLSPSNRPRP